VRTLWLLRHAKSSWDDPGLPDHDRPLARRGQKAAKRIRGFAADTGVAPELVLCSTATRARETLDRVLPGLGSPEVRVESGIYLASAGALLELLRRAGEDAESVMLVGHDPGLHDLACVLAPPGPETLPTGALAEIALDVDAWDEACEGCGSLVRLTLPRELG
jgi:phosphohistidine phosphatase